ncbi:translation initiation factor IF-2 [Candidatus Bathyarchaeota archaeon]|nr:MAG: translation initiation factor IF-2 [Candidatus Bathyarchaeota archaeon]
MPLRQPIVCVLGHIDVGKTLLLDKIRKTSVQAREAGGITQHIGASFFPMETLMEICGPLIKAYKGEIKIPGLLIIDTPGHEVFANLRRRGGSVADIAILVIDIMEGFQAQTYECLSILEARRTPFLVAANKIDRIPGWKPIPDAPFMVSYQKQDPYVRMDLDERIYSIIGTFSRLGYKADRFDRIRFGEIKTYDELVKTVPIVPTSAKTGEGIVELLAVLIGLTQQYLRHRLAVTSGPAKGTVLEVREEIGLGTTVNAIIYDGVLRRGDTIVLGGKKGPIITKVRAILMPKPLDEIRDPREKFSSVEEVHAAAGVKIVAPDLDDAIAGSPIFVVPEGEGPDEYVRAVQAELEKVRIITDKTGIVVKADALGSLEAIVQSLARRNVPVRIADVGDVCKSDVIEAAVVREKDEAYGAILAFNVKVLPDAEEEARARGVRIFESNIIYTLIDDYVRWATELRETKLRREFEALVKPGKIRILPGFVFRRSRPAIVGVEVLAGRIKPRYRLVRPDGRDIGQILQIQDRKKAIPEARKGAQVAISIDKAIVGRHIDEGDVLYVNVPPEDRRKLLEKFRDKLTPEEVEVLRELEEIMREKLLSELGW